MFGKGVYSKIKTNIGGGDEIIEFDYTIMILYDNNFKTLASQIIV